MFYQPPTGTSRRWDDPAPDGEQSPGAEIFAPKTIGSANAEFDAAYYWQNTAACRDTGRVLAQFRGLFRCHARMSYARFYTLTTTSRSGGVC